MIGAERHLTALDLDGAEWGDTVPARREQVEAHTARCAACALRRAEHAEHLRHFRTTVFPRTSAALADRRARAPRRLWLLGFVAPAAAGILLVVRGIGAGGLPATTALKPATNAEPAIGIKGDPLFHVFVRRARAAPGTAASVVQVADGAQLAPGDALRFVLPPADLPYVMIASIDGTGHASVYYPYRGQTSAPVDLGTRLAVPNSIVLDAAPGPERLFVIYSETPLSADTVRQTLARSASGGASGIRALRRLPLPGTIQSTLLFEKDVPR